MGSSKRRGLRIRYLRLQSARSCRSRRLHKRDRAILSTLLYHALRREELCKLKVKDFRHARRGVQHLRVSGKGEKTRWGSHFVPTYAQIVSMTPQEVLDKSQQL